MIDLPGCPEVRFRNQRWLKKEWLRGFVWGKVKIPLEGIDGQEGEMTGLFDIRNGEIPFSQNLYQQKSLGRLGQLMTLLVAYETFNLDTSVTIQQEDLLNDLDRDLWLISKRT